MVKETTYAKQEGNLYHEWYAHCVESFDMLMRDRQWVNRDPEKFGLQMPPKYSLAAKLEKFLLELDLFTSSSRKSKKKILVL